jgi:D-glycero-D-manno-heptose 1,7-bisphosphate phosphatase
MPRPSANGRRVFDWLKMIRPAVFLDRDGVINYNRPDHVKSWSEFEFLPGVLAALRRLARLQWPIVVISNQAAIGRGMASRQAVDDINARMVKAVQEAGGRIDDIFYCPHRPDEECACRKPRPGLLLRAAERLQLDLGRSFLVGDAESDVLAARAVNCRPVLVRTGRGWEQLATLRQQNASFYVADDLGGAVDWILTQVDQPD